jgi:hypothetical protein
MNLKKALIYGNDRSNMIRRVELMKQAGSEVLDAENAKWPEHLVEMPRSKWEHLPQIQAKISKVWRSRRFLVQQYEKNQGAIRLSVIKAQTSDHPGSFADGITWDELQEIKSQCGFGDCTAVEIYPPDAHVINVANMRHLWIVEIPFGFQWRKDGA